MGTAGGISAWVAEAPDLEVMPVRQMSRHGGIQARLLEAQPNGWGGNQHDEAAPWQRAWSPARPGYTAGQRAGLSGTAMGQGGIVLDRAGEPLVMATPLAGLRLKQGEMLEQLVGCALDIILDGLPGLLRITTSKPIKTGIVALHGVSTIDVVAGLTGCTDG